MASPSHEVQEKAQRFLAEKRVISINARCAIVSGDSDVYRVYATREHVTCTCPAKGTCSHILAAMAFWGDDVGV